MELEESQEYLKRSALKFLRSKWKIKGIARIFEAECA